MAKNRFDLIVFDWDGTLMDSTAAIVQSIQRAARDVGLPPPEDASAAYVIGLSLAEALQRLMPDLDAKYYPRLVERYRFHYLAQDHALPLFPGVREMLEALLQKGYFLAVATGKSRVGLNRALHHAQLLGTFDATRCADETFSKPHPAMLQELSRELGQSLERTLMIGDTVYDLQMAHNAGAQSVAVLYGAHPEAVLREHTPLYAAASVPELHTWLLEHA